jgi:Tol biopolymer transport system component
MSSISRILFVGILLAATGPGWAQTGITSYLLKNPQGGGGKGESGNLDVSADGRYVAFEGTASFFRYPPSYPDPIFVLDRRTGQFELASVSSSGQPAWNSCQWPSISADGSVVAFSTEASNLVPQRDWNWSKDVFVRDLRNQTTELVSVTLDGGGGYGDSSLPAVSGDGRFVAFRSGTPNLVSMPTESKSWWSQVYVRDRRLGKTELISVDIYGGFASGDCSAPAISHDGRFVAFASESDDLVAHDANGEWCDVFVRDRLKGTTELVSVGSDGLQGRLYSGMPYMGADWDYERTVAISDDGQVVAFNTHPDSGLVLLPHNVFWADAILVVHDRRTGSTELVSVSDRGEVAEINSTCPVLSKDGSYVAFLSHGTNLVLPGGVGEPGVYLRDRLSKRTLHINESSAGTKEGWKNFPPAISADGQQIFFSSSGVLSPLALNSGEFKLYVHDTRPPSPFFYCTQPPNPWCTSTTPRLESVGHPSRSAGEGFWVKAWSLPKQSWSQFVYGVSGPASTPFSAGTLCVQGPLKRMGPVARNKNEQVFPYLCIGSRSLDVGRFLDSGEDPALEPGVTVQLQCIASVPAEVASTNRHLLTPALEFTIQP